MKHPLLIRSIRESDFNAWNRLWDDYNRFYGRHGATALPAEITCTTWARFFEAEEPMHSLVAERAGSVLGLAHFLYHRSTIAIAPTCYLQDLFTVTSARGQGVAQALIEQVYTRAAQAGCKRVYWQTHETNTTAMRVYDKVAEKSGFIVYRKNL